MKQIVPFKKELPFKTKVSEITSISLEREINVEEEGIITGVFHITGNYKMNEGSINRDDFSFDLPFDITLDPRYDISTVKADIDDFYYDVINSDTLSVNIDLFIEAEYLPEDVTKEEDILDEKAETEEIEEVRVEKIKVDDVKDDIPVVDEKKEEIMGKIGTEEIKEETRDNDNITASDLFSNLDDSETYTTYYVYIVKEEDTIDKILVKYSISKEEYLNGQVSKPRNPILANIFFRLKYVEMFGTGILRIKQLYQSMKFKPDFKIYENSISIVLPLVDLKLNVSVDEEQIINYLSNCIHASSSDIAKSCGYTKDKTLRLLKLLQSKGYVKVSGNGKATKYSI